MKKKQLYLEKEDNTLENNRAWCQERGIIMSGPPLGRPPADVSKEKKKQALESERIRNCIEGKFGESSPEGGFPSVGDWRTRRVRGKGDLVSVE